MVTGRDWKVYFAHAHFSNLYNDQPPESVSVCYALSSSRNLLSLEPYSRTFSRRNPIPSTSPKRTKIKEIMRMREGNFVQVSNPHLSTIDEDFLVRFKMHTNQGSMDQNWLVPDRAVRSWSQNWTQPDQDKENFNNRGPFQGRISRAYISRFLIISSNRLDLNFGARHRPISGKIIQLAIFYCLAWQKSISWKIIQAI